MDGKAIIFDFDGVLVDSEAHWPGINVRIMAEILPSRPWTSHDDRRIVGHNLESVHGLLTSEYGLPLDLPAYRDVVWKHAGLIYDSLALPMPGVVRFIERARALGIPMGVASSNERSRIDVAVKRLGLEPYFRVVFGIDDVGGKGKPDPAVYLAAAEALGTNPADCVAIEDSPSGIAAAKAAGMFCVALVSHHNSTHDVSAADMRTGGFDELTGSLLA